MHHRHLQHLMMMSDDDHHPDDDWVCMDLDHEI